MDNVTKDQVMSYISSWLQVPENELKDSTLVGHIDGLGEVCCFKFGKTIVVQNKATFTLGDLVYQLTAPDFE